MPNFVHLTIAAVMLGLAGTTSAQTTPESSRWQVAGEQGLVRFVIVPAAQARERDAYVQQIHHLCEPERTCFLNFYTNSTAAAVALPLPDAIDREATAVFRRSAKQGPKGSSGVAGCRSATTRASDAAPRYQLSGSIR